MTTYCYGCGGIGAVAGEMAIEQLDDFAGFIDDDIEKTTFAGYPVVTGNEYFNNADKYGASKLIIGVSNSYAKEKIAARYQSRVIGLSHGTAVKSSSAQLGTGVLRFMRSIVQTNTVLGDCVLLNTACSIDHDCVVGDFVHFAPHSTVCGYVKIGSYTEIGAGAVVLPGLEIGANVHVGAGAVVTKNIPDNQTVVGIPAKPLKR